MWTVKATLKNHIIIKYITFFCAKLVFILSQLNPGKDFNFWK